MLSLVNAVNEIIRGCLWYNFIAKGVLKDFVDNAFNFKVIYFFSFR